ncbi:MAG: PAS domain S-box protein [candidate division Zixibacteria bacterium]|nr:PAS domain S-box protein [candidate division Zixibacteria bacterium]
MRDKNDKLDYDAIMDKTAEEIANTKNIDLISEIGERKKAEDRQRFMAGILKKLNRIDVKSDPIKSILSIIKDFSGFEAVGIRLAKDQDYPYQDYPYYETIGFPGSFVERESSLCVMSNDGKVLLDSESRPVLACMCGNVIRGRINSSLPFFTISGSFWTNSTSKMLASTTEEDRQGHTRDYCNRAGYETVALIPLHFNQEIIGLLQLNDKRPNMLNQDMIHFYEDIGDSIGIALARTQSELALKESEKKYRALFDNSTDAILILDEDRFIDFNEATIKMLRYKNKEDIIRTHPWEISPERQPDGRLSSEKAKEMIDIAFTHGSNRFEWDHRKADGEVFPVEVLLTAVPIGNKRVLHVVWRDITERKRVDRAIKNMAFGESLKFGGKFFDSTVIQLSEILKADYVLIGELIDRKFEQVSTLSFCADGKIMANFIYELKNTPCENVIGKRICSYPSNAADIFAEDHLLKQMGIEGYSGLPLFDSQGKPLGIIVALFRNELKDVNSVESILQLFSPRTTAEIERKHAEEALHRSEEKYRNLFETMAQGVIYQNVSGEIISANPAAAKILGLTLDQMQGRTSIDHRWKSIHEDGSDFPGQDHPAMEALRTGKEINDVIMGIFNPSNDCYRWIKINSVPQFKPGEDKPFQVFTTFDDFTQRKRAEHALHESENKFRNIVQSAPMGMHSYQLERDGNLIFTGANAAAKKILGIDHENLIGKTIEKAFPGLTKTEVPEIYKSIALEGEFWKSEQIDYDTDRIRGAFDVFAFQTSPGKMTAMFTDITVRKRAEEALEAEKERLAVTLGSIGEGVITTDIIGKIVLINKIAQELTGWNEREAVGKPLDDVYKTIDEKAKKAADNPFAKVISRNSIVELGSDKILVARDGREHFIADSGAPIRNRNGETIGIVLVFRDVTKTRRLQEFISRAQRLETAGRISGQIAHDFNNLLSPLVAYPEFIRRLIPKDHPSRQYLSKMESAAAQIAEINQQLLTLSRRGHYNLEPLNLNDIVTGVINQMHLIDSKLQLELKLNGQLMNIRGGSSQISRVIANILANASDAMKSTGKLSLKTENYYADQVSEKFGRVPKGEYIKLTITDDGEGIEEEKLPKIFEPFFTTKIASRKKGSGLGLSVVYTVMEDHNGYVDLNSKVGEGTSFYLYFPVTRESIKKLNAVDIVGGNEMILIVDDDRMQRDVSFELLKTLGYKTYAVESGEKALEFLKSNKPDLLILDMIMPDGMDGADTYRKAQEIIPSQRAIIISGFAESERVEAAIKLGAGSCTRKPLTLKTIALAVRKELDRQPVVSQ